jgi:pimeloyl-ACP methyl ester carboxylesterase
MLRIAILAAVAAVALAAPREPTHEFFTTSDGIKIHYMQLGETGSYVVLIHGYTGSAEGNWFRNGIAAALAANHRVVALDCRNHGRSDKPQLNGPGKAEDVIELMDHLKIQKAHIHGYSMGGAITGQLLAAHPEHSLRPHLAVRVFRKSIRSGSPSCRRTNRASIRRRPHCPTFCAFTMRWTTA